MANVTLKTYTVKKGDTLWAIALANGTTYQKLAAINKIANPDLIYVGQMIQFDPPSAPVTDVVESNFAKITHFGLQSNVDNTLFAMWEWSKSDTTEKYQYSWDYYVPGNKLWFTGSSGANSVDENDPNASRCSTYSIPANASRVRFRVKPIAKSKNNNSTSSKQWTASWTGYEIFNVSDVPPATPTKPDVTIENYKLTARLDGLPENVTSVRFQVVQDDASAVYKTGSANTKTGSATFSCQVAAGSKYKVRCRAERDGLHSEWSEYSSNELTPPSTPEWVTSNACKASSKTSVILSWNATKAAEEYEIEYATSEDAFLGSNKTTTATTDKTRHELDGLETGKRYFFRVRATNSAGSSGWSHIRNVAIGTDPVAPTTWSSTTTAIVGESVNLYWVHNSEDGSSQTYAELEIYENGVKQLPTTTIKNSTEEDEKDKTSVFELSTSEYTEGVKIEWRVRTSGITNTYGDWSIMRTIDIYAAPTVSLSLTNAGDAAIDGTLHSFPFYLEALAGPNTQKPTGYHVSITAGATYETVDRVGNEVTVSEGDQVYSKYFDTSDVLLVEFSAHNLDLESDVPYTIKCVVSMDSGLTAEDSIEITPSWTEDVPIPNAEIGIYEEACTAHIRPYCEYYKSNIRQVIRLSGTKKFTITDTVLYGVYGKPTGGTYDNTHTTTGEQVWYGVDVNGENVYYCYVKSGERVQNVTLSVYRREFDGTFTELATDIDNDSDTYVHDPHPALDYARYRVVATSKVTGAVSYYDVPGYSVGIKAVIIQWDENWSSFDVTNEDAQVEPAWSGSLLKLPYNIDISDDNKPDMSLIEYIGREHPVSYYGTQLGTTSTWKVDIPKSDKDTLYALRRLARWMGDVYVREPSGSGYWANVTVSFSQTHLDQKIPVTLRVARVEGGM